MKALPDKRRQEKREKMGCREDGEDGKKRRVKQRVGMREGRRTEKEGKEEGGIRLRKIEQRSKQEGGENGRGKRK